MSYAFETLNTRKHHIILRNFSAIKEKLNVKELRAKQKYKSTRLEKIIGQWPGDESIEELLEMRKK